MNIVEKIILDELRWAGSDVARSPEERAKSAAKRILEELQKALAPTPEIHMSTAADAQLAAEAGIPLRILLAIRQLESGGAVRAVRFEPHVFNRLTSNRFRTQIPFTPDPERGVSLIGTETNRAAFERARALDANAAIRATSWGLYQVLGGLLIAAYPSDPVGSFDRNPEEASDKILVAWFRSRPAAAAAAQAGDIEELARLYNGSVRWGQRLRAILAAQTGAISAPAPVPATCTAILIGDSQAVGMKTFLETGLRERRITLATTFANVGWSTKRTLDNLGARIRTSVQRHHHKLALVVLGGNDTPSDTLATAIVDLVRLLFENGVTYVVWVGPAHARDPEIFARKAQVSQLQRTILAPIQNTTWINGTAMSADLQHTPDGVHFVRAAQEIWAKRILESITPGVNPLWNLTPFAALLRDELEGC